LLLRWGRAGVAACLCLILWIAILHGSAVQALAFGCPVDVAPCPASVLWVTGEIVDGDADRFAAELQRRGPEVATVILADSIGGSGEEAWKIGRLVRTLHLMTAIGWALASHDPSAIKGTSPTIHYPEAAAVRPDGSWAIPAQNFRKSLCASACVDIWLGGTFRFGDAYLGIHRPIMVSVPGTAASQNEPPRTFTGEVARWAQYLEEMDAPQTLLDQSMAVPNDQVKLLDLAFVEHALLTRSISDELWMLIHCGAAFPNALAVAHGKISLERVAALSQCAAQQLKDERTSAWSSAFGP
jgi:hypothetical protein